MIAAASCVMAANAEPFTYQGQLTDAGMPANGTYDITLEVTDAAVGGAIIGTGSTFTNVAVVDGLFELEFDPGDIFSAQDVWLRVTIDDGGGAVTLTPNSPITAAPKAQHATTADTALNAPWTAAPGIITYGDGDDRVFINRTDAITASEFFGVHGTNSSFNGMYMSGPENSLPFYGYSTNENIDAYHYYNGVTGEWILVSNSTEAVVFDVQNEMTVANNINADGYQYKSPKTQVLSISGSAFYSSSGIQFVVSPANGGAFQAQASSGSLVAPVQLPQGAVFQSMTAYVGDEAAGDVAVSLRYRAHDNSDSSFVFYKDTSSSSGPSLVLTDTIPATGYETVDNYAGHYHLGVFSTAWPGNSTMRVTSVLIEYTIDEVD